MHGKGSVKLSINNASHMARSSTEAVYTYYSKRGTRHCFWLSETEMASNQSGIVKQPVAFHKETRKGINFDWDGTRK